MVRTNELVAARKRLGITQEQAATALKCSKNTYCAKETNRAKFDVDEALNLCELLKIDDNNQRAYIFLSHLSQNRESKQR